MIDLDIAVPCDDVVGGIGPVFRVLGQHHVGGPPVAGVDQLLAAQFVAEVGRHLGVELVHEPRQELRLVGRALLEAGYLALLVAAVARQVPAS